MPKHILLLLLLCHSVSRKHHGTTKFTCHSAGTPQSNTPPRKGFAHRQPPAATVIPAILCKANSWPTFPAIPKHTECWLYPSSSCPFFRRKKSIEIDLKMSNLISCQLSLQDRYFMDDVNAWSHQGSSPGSWQPVVLPINPQIFSGSLMEKGVARHSG